jgi:hypothetical protein
VTARITLLDMMMGMATASVAVTMKRVSIPTLIQHLPGKKV